MGTVTDPGAGSSSPDDRAAGRPAQGSPDSHRRVAGARGQTADQLARFLEHLSVGSGPPPGWCQAGAPVVELPQQLSDWRRRDLPDRAGRCSSAETARGSADERERRVRIVPPPRPSGVDRRAPARPERARPRRAIGSAPDLDPLDRLIGRAVIDARFRALLLADPLSALRTEPMPLRLKRALVTIRARTLGDFALRALDLQADLPADDWLGPDTRPAVRGAPAAGRVGPDASARDAGPAGGLCLTRVTRLVVRDRAEAGCSAPTPALARPRL